jgi:hypothetical protein
MSDAEPKSITGRGAARDRLIMCNALAYAILTIESLPQEQQEYSNKEDMKVMLDHFSANFLGYAYFLEGARHHMDGTGFKES